MQKIFLTLAGILALLNSGQTWGKTIPDSGGIDALHIQSEYRQDSLDYEEKEKSYFREKVSVHFSKASQINTAYVQTKKDNEKQFSWNIILRDISPTTSFIVGHFYTNFASGLLIGKPSQYNPDPFSRVRSMDKKNNKTCFKPCNSGNPTPAMQGIGISYFKHFNVLDLSVDGFYSSKKRYIDLDSYQEKSTGSALWTIESHDKSDKTKTEPVELRTHGCAFSIILLRLIQFQLHYIFTDINSYSGRKIAWGRWSSEPDSRRTTELLGTGFSVQYQDDYIHLFFEGDQIHRKILMGMEEERIRGTGIISGIRFKNSPFMFSLTVKNTKKDYHSPYESTVGERYPERAWFMDTEIRPVRGLKTGGKVSSERKNSVGIRDKEISNTRRETLFLAYSRKYIREIKIQLRRTEKTASGSYEKKKQYKGISKFLPFSMLQIDFSGTYQTCSNYGASKFLIAGTTIRAGRIFSITGSYGKASIAEKNPLYAVISPIRYSNIPGAFVRENSRIRVVRSTLKYMGFFLSCRYFDQRGDTEPLLRRVEFIGSGVF